MEITSINDFYLQNAQLNVEIMQRGYTWLDTGTHDSLLVASSYIATIQNRQGLLIGSPEEVAYVNGWISEDDVKRNIQKYSKTSYGRLLETALLKL